ncbi:MAG TPA: glycosyltransferase [Candidatus Acidoferrales bacterium]
MNAERYLTRTQNPTAPLRDRVLLVALLYDYDKPERGYSYEYYTNFAGLQQLFTEAELFDFGTCCREHGREGMNHILLDYVRSARPVLTMIAPFLDELVPETFPQMKGATTTLLYFFDDIWRLDFARRWVPHVDFFTTPSSWPYRRYLDQGYANAIYSPFGFDPRQYTKGTGERQHDVTFVGGVHPYRLFLIKKLQQAGIRVQAWGSYWPSGRVTQAQMVEIFQRSKISLNITNSTTTYDPAHALEYFLSSPRAIRTVLRSRKTKEQMKARHFELPACGAMELTYYAEDLEHHFEIGKELAIYMDLGDLIEKARYYLRHDDEREAIAAAGYARAHRDHTIDRRLTDIVGHVFGEEYVKTALATPSQVAKLS